MEEIIISGRHNKYIDPNLHIWGWEIPLYLFLGGLVAGILFFSSLMYLLGKEKQFNAAVKVAPMVAPFLLMIGLGALLLDLKHVTYFWRLFLTIKLESPMSWGAWALMFITPLSMAWAFLNVKDVFPKVNITNNLLIKLEVFLRKYIKTIAWMMLFSAMVLGMYTGILLSALNARPLWSTSILGPLFLVSGLSTGAAFIIMLAKDHEERILFTKIDIGLILVEIFIIAHMFIGFYAGNEVQIDTIELFFGGEFTLMFWLFVMTLGLIIPVILEVLELNKYYIPAYIPAILILLGGLILRFVIVAAGQLSSYM